MRIRAPQRIDLGFDRARAHPVLPHRAPEHYPHRFSKHLATRHPSTSSVKSRRPRHKVRTPGIPSFVRFSGSSPERAQPIEITQI